MDTVTTNHIFAAAAGATSWKRTNLGLSTRISYRSYTYTVQLPKGSGRAYISGREGCGGSEVMSVNASWAQTRPIVEIAMDASRLR
ncbi:hypothetical protein [Streptomyces sp. NPDC086782]|uniref:hypothetical protein n=1 Tax=Streptomyces sp. NPDC086782 TaxID=3365757 RepID=UPI00382C9B2E